MGLMKKNLTIVLISAGLISVASSVYAGKQNKWILEYTFMSGSTVVGEQVINQCTSTEFTTGQVTANKVLRASEPCSYDHSKNPEPQR
ncbi:hypothetical protein [Shewanella fidelis]|uniref:Uncharacterized protein n=1 Tax=Shewanella fidelis TaxID=173509 RepID=A0AAW8NSB5_9GAMM|nr:hypothetical protein [Shewanella fidelis]MDR8525315.1 hypothetical protein [Shewanella fidelis]MDW4813648.1 hypothetical protein [Shewanella fidelis]MDW4817694.1 hypothetical protein [Shewanella fidelis]MDW4821761.1 hypothetical protein [Shewanella fidelis]MDW4825976.1 hypothetical protein [Shewanella fidelis]